ncbi:MAG: hypothetical protein DRJ96_07150 [Thermoprotei archaeon]|nr:MAG: hypothetical protein DRJ67_07790 [Thermoprotei archaeon]RLE96247.1 MAG: hypothetical protein DRJ96_07150 [Thermoprotei archaeon]
MQAGRGLREEALWLLGHMINLEEHLDEFIAARPELADVVRAVRENRAALAEAYRRLYGADEGRFRAMWCIIKHAASALIHAQEVASMAAQHGDPELAAEASKLLKDLLGFADSFMEFLKEGGGDECTG